MAGPRSSVVFPSSPMTENSGRLPFPKGKTARERGKMAEGRGKTVGERGKVAGEWGKMTGRSGPAVRERSSVPQNSSLALRNVPRTVRGLGGTPRIGGQRSGAQTSANPKARECGTLMKIPVRRLAALLMHPLAFQAARMGESVTWCL
jgi:hypothetical protein